MEEIQSLTKQLEYIFLKKTIEGLRNNKLSAEYAKLSSKEFLAIYPPPLLKMHM